MAYTDLPSYALRQLANCNISKAIVAINAAAAATIKTTNALLYSVNGVLISAAALAARALTLPPADAKFTPIPFYNVPASTTSYILLVANAAGTVFAIQSQHQGRDLSFMNRPDKGDGNVPETPDGYTPIGLIKAVTNGATNWLPGTDALDKAGVTFTFYDLLINPIGKP
jgi:hypothetical protein